MKGTILSTCPDAQYEGKVYTYVGTFLRSNGQVFNLFDPTCQLASIQPGNQILAYLYVISYCIVDSSDEQTIQGIIRTKKPERSNSFYQAEWFENKSCGIETPDGFLFLDLQTTEGKIKRDQLTDGANVYVQIEYDVYLKDFKLLNELNPPKI